MRTSRGTIFLVVGVVLAVLAGLTVYVLAQQAAQQQAPVEPTTAIVVAKVEIPERTVLTADMLDTKAFPRSLVPSGAIADVAVAERQTTLVKIPIGAPILATQVAAGGGATGVSLTIEKGKVFVAFPVSDPLMTAGQIKAGDHVDILATITQGQLEPALAARATATPAPTATPTGSPAPASPGPSPTPKLSGAVTQTVLQNLEVVSVIGTNTLTFVVDHQTALILKNLKDTGIVVDIVIRSRSETDTAKTKPVDPLFIVETYGFRQ